MDMLSTPPTSDVKVIDRLSYYFTSLKLNHNTPSTQPPFFYVAYFRYNTIIVNLLDCDWLKRSKKCVINV